MNVEFKARKYLGELYNKHLNEEQGDFSKDVVIEGVDVALFLQKDLSIGSKVHMEIHTPTMRYRYSYSGDTTKPFDIAALDPQGATYLAYED